MSEETAGYQVGKTPLLNDRMRARSYYAAAVSLFQTPSASDCEKAIELLNEAVDLHSDFSEASLFREDLWYYLLKSFGWGHNNTTYKKYLDSPAWQVKRDKVIQRDGGHCVCGAQATQVHHKNYDHIGKEPLEELVALCEDCHNRVHQAREQYVMKQSPFKKAFIAYVDRESAILQRADFGPGESPDYVAYESGYQKENGYHEIWLAAWIPANRNDIAAVIAIRYDSRYFGSHYKKFEEHKRRIEKVFSFEEIKPKKANDKIFHLRVVKKGIDLTQEAERDAGFRFLRETLEKLYWVFRVHDASGWDTAASTEKLEG